jgi:hypothetical protein
LFVTGEMLAAVAQDAASVTIAAPDEGVEVEGVDGKFYGPREEAAARLLPGPELHARAAQLLLRELAP